MKIAYFDCFSGASGDMLLGSLLDAGLPLKELQADLARLRVGGYRLAARRVTRQGLSGTHFEVHIETGEQPARTLPAIEQILAHGDLPSHVQDRCRSVFARLAQVEAAVHGTTIDQVHFHELGAVDTLVDVVGFVCALERLEIEAIYSSPLPLGGGTVHTEHGRLPVPAPATLALLSQVGAPTVPGPVQAELLTPTGAVLLTELAAFERPAMTIKAIGYGFGTKEFGPAEDAPPGWANALRVWLGTDEVTLPSLAAAPSLESDQVVLLACNLDDATGETMGYAMDRLLAAGALDVWFTPIQMKKNRPATQLSVLCQPQDAGVMAALLLRETPTLGVRQLLLTRSKAAREVRQVETPWGTVRVKVKVLAGQAVAASPEYDDCARLAMQAGVPLQQVMDAARREAECLLEPSTTT
jgi:uncharacterized protein (TIGR00299 family) protein